MGPTIGQAESYEKAASTIMESSPQAHPRILAIRHGESEWNVLHRKYPTEEERYHPRMWTIDCGLTERGVDQAKQAGLELEQQTLPDGVDLVVVSPLRRALDTAQHIVHEFHNHKRESKLATKIPLVQISKDAAEVMVDPCDIGSTPRQLEIDYPQRDFSNLEQHWWHGGKSPSEALKSMVERKWLETAKDAQARIQGRLLDYLKGEAKNFSTIVIVCHSDTIWWLTRTQHENGEYFGQRAENGEILDITDHVLGHKQQPRRVHD